MKLDELARRRPNFAPGIPIVLDDGQAWQFPRPRIVFRRTFRDDVPDLEGRTTLGRDFDASLDRLRIAETIGDIALGYLELASVMLRINYELSDADLNALLVYDHDDDANHEFWRQVRDIALGVAPKPSTAGAG